MLKSSPLKHKGSHTPYPTEEEYHEVFPGVEEEEEKKPGLTPWGGGKTHMHANFVKKESGEIVDKNLKTEEEIKVIEEKKRETAVGKLNEEFGEDNVDKIANFFNTGQEDRATKKFNVSPEDLEITSGTDNQDFLQSSGNIYMVKHSGKGNEENYFAQRHFVEILDDGTVEFRTENEVKDRDSKFFEKSNKKNKKKYYEAGTELSYFDDFKRVTGSGDKDYVLADDDKYDEDDVVSYLNLQLKKYGIKAKRTWGMAGTDHITLEDENGNTQQVPLDAYRFKGGQGPFNVDLVENSGDRIKQIISSFVKSNGRKFPGELEFSESTIEKNKKRVEGLKDIVTEDGAEYVLNNDIKQKGKDAKELLKEYNKLETDEEKNKFLEDNGYSTDLINVKDYALRNNIKDASMMADEEVTQLELETMSMLNYGLSKEDADKHKEIYSNQEKLDLFKEVDTALDQLVIGDDSFRMFVGREIYNIEDDTIEIKNEDVRAWIASHLLKPENREQLTRIKAGGADISEKEELIQRAESAVLNNNLVKLQVEKDGFDVAQGVNEKERITIQNKLEVANENEATMFNKVNPISNNLDELEIQGENLSSEISELVDELNGFDVDNLDDEGIKDYNSLYNDYLKKRKLLDEVGVDWEKKRLKYNNLIESDEMKNLVNESALLNEQSIAFSDRSKETAIKGKNLTSKYDELFADLGFNAHKRIWDDNFKATTAYKKYNHGNEDSPTMDALSTFTESMWDTLGLKVLAFGSQIGTGLIRLSSGDDPTKYEYVNVVDDYVESLINKNIFGPVLPREEGIAEGGFSYKNTLKTVAEMLPYTLGIILSARTGKVTPMRTATGAFNPKAITAGSNALLHRQVNMIKVSSLMTQYDNLLDGEANGLTGWRKWQFASALSLGTGVSQLVMPDQMFLSGVPGKVFKGSLIKNLKLAANVEAGKQVIKTSLQNLGKELGEEELELLMHDAVRMSMGLGHTTQFQDINAHKDLLVATTMLTGSLQSIGGVRQYNAVKKQVYQTHEIDLLQNVQNVQTQLSVVENKLARFKKLENAPSGKIAALEEQQKKLNKTEVQARAQLYAAQNASGYASVEHKDLLIEKFKLIQNKEGTTDKGELSLINDQIKELDTKLEGSKAHEKYLEAQRKDVERTKAKAKAKYGNAVDVREAETNEEATEAIEIGLNEAIQGINNDIRDAIKNRNQEGGEKALIDLKLKRTEYVNALNSIGNIDTEINTSQEIKLIDEQILKLDPKKNQKNIQELTDKRNQLENKLNQSLGFGGFNANGFITPPDASGKRTIIINKKEALRSGYVTTGQHEFLHAVLNDAVGEENQPGLAAAMFGFINENKNIKGGSELNARLQNYDGSGQFMEVMPLLSEALTRKDVVASEGFLQNMKDVYRQFMQRHGMADITFDTGQDVFNFIKDYNKSINSKTENKAFAKATKEGISGKLVNQAKERVEGTQFSKSIKNTFAEHPDMKVGFDKLTQTEEGDKKWGSKADYQNSPEYWDGYMEIENSKGLESLIKFGVASQTGIKTAEEMDVFVDEVKQNLLKRYKNNFNPSMANGSLFGWLVGGSGKYTESTLYRAKGDVMGKYGKQVSTTSLDQTRVNAEGDTFASQIEGEEDARLKAFEKEDQTKSAKPTISKKDRIRKLHSLSNVYGAVTPVDLNNKIQAIIEKNPKNLEGEIRKLIEKEVTKAVKAQMGKIENKKGEVVISDEYKAFLALNYENIVKGLDVATIKNNYKTLFDLELIGKEDKKTKKSDKPSLKKDSNFRKGIYKITTNKAKFTKFFIEGGYTTLLARQKGLAKLIAESITENVINDQITENSKDLSAITKVEMKEFANSLNRQKKELQGNYKDIIQYSKNKVADAKYIGDKVEELGSDKVFDLNTGKLLPKWKKELKEKRDDDAADFIYSLVKSNKIIDPKGVSYLQKMYQKLFKAGKRGEAYEASIIDMVKALEKVVGIDKIEAILRKPTEVDGKPDAIIRLYNSVFNVEAKMANAQYSSVTFALNEKGKFIIKKDYTFADEILKKLGNGVQEGIELAKARLKEENFTWTDLSILPDDMYYILKNERVTIDGKEQSYLNAMSSEMDIDLDVVSEIYNKKAKYPVNYMQMMGRGLFYMGGHNDAANVLGTTELKGKATIKLRIGSNSQYKTVKGVRSKTGNKTLAWRAIPGIPNSTLETLKSNHSIGNVDGMMNLLNSPEGKALAQFSKASDAKTVSNAIQFSRTVNSPKGITVLDFDDTLATSKSLIRFTKPDGTKGTLNAEQYASTYQELTDLGYKWDFSEFNKVVDGKVAPLFQKALKLQGKFSPKDMFVLTARPAEAAPAIHAFLKANGLNIPMKNITGLANSTAEAKALWMAEKVGEGYNDFYFADDALQNVQAVKNMLDQFDVKSKVQQAKIQFSKGINKNFNDILEQTTGVKSLKQFSDAQAKIRGAKTKYKSIIPASAQDFKGLLYNFIGKGKKGEADMAFFQKALIDPFARGISELNTSRQNSANDYKNLQKAFPGTKKILKEKVSGDFNVDQAIRVYLWNKAGFEVPGLSKRDLKTLVDFVKNDPQTQAFADGIGLISKKDNGYSKPGDFWLAENITSDLLSDGSIGDARADVMTEWQQNVNVVFSKENLNKIEAIYGSNFREALEDSLYRMRTGRNRPAGGGRIMNNYMNWVNNSVGAIMFFNMRSAILQTISATNYINWSFNNPAKAAVAFANQPQYWKDFSMLFNSPYLKQRRSGNQRGINEAELSAAVAGAENKAKAAIAWILKKGFLPTQMADSFAIASGGATFYRNKVKALIKEGMTQEQAEKQAFLTFQETTEVSQQSARPDMISQQQASPLGRLILSFQNTPMQYARIMNKAARDLVNGRGDTKTHLSKMAYYGIAQSILFGALQSALMASMGDDEEDDFDKKKERILNGMIDSVLSGIGYGGKAVSTVKNAIREYIKQKDKGWNADHTYTILSLLSFSPPIGSKLRKIYGSIQTEQFNQGVFTKRGLTLDNPIWSGIGNIVEGVTNIPLGRISQKMLNIDNAMDDNNSFWERTALLLGWNTWDLGIKDPDIQAVKDEIKVEKEVESKKKQKIKKEEKKKETEEANKAVIEENKKKSKKDGICSAISKGGKRCKTKVVEGDSFCTVHEKATQNKTGEKTQCKFMKQITKKKTKQCGMMTSNKSGNCYYHD